MVDENPYSNIKLPLMDQHGLFYVFLNNEAVMFHLVVIG
jgi:hypothetical protein